MKSVMNATLPVEVWAAEQEFFAEEPLPALREYFSAFKIEHILAIVLATLLFLIIEYLFIRKIPQILRTTPKLFVSRTMVLCGLYTIVAAAALTSILVPKAIIFCDAICHITFTMGAYQFFCICIDYVGGETTFIKRTAGLRAFNLQVPPFCCFFKFLKSTPVTKSKFLVIRMMILQMSVIQGILLCASNIAYIEDPESHPVYLLYLVPLMVASILTGVWGLQILVKMIGPLFPELKLFGKFVCVQSVLVLCKLQPVIFQTVFKFIKINSGYPMNSRVIANIAVQLAILVEMTVLSIFAHSLYQTPSKRPGEYY